MSSIKVWLTGGSSYVTDSMRPAEVENLSETVKLRCGNGYEHFGYSGGTAPVEDGETRVVFVWTGRTRIAE